MDVVTARRTRLHNLGLGAQPAGSSPADVVRHLVAVQSQEHGPALWSVGQRRGGHEHEVAAALDAGRLLRTHVLRTTWHDVAADELRWLLQVTAPRVMAGEQPRLRMLGLDAATMARCHSLLASALEELGSLTRPQAREVLAAAGLPLEATALSHVLMHAELEGLVTSGPRRGQQHTYVLAEHRLPPAGPALDEGTALAALVTRYFTSHGPATAKDCAWWASLTLTQVRTGVAAAGDALVSHELEGLDGVPAWSAPAWRPLAAAEGPDLALLQGYDEYTVAYRETRYLLDPAGILRGLPKGRPVHNLVLVVDGLLTGHWKRTVRAGRLEVDVVTYRALEGDERAALGHAASEHAAFLGLEPDQVQVGVRPHAP